jgi:hypothetical protein
MNGRSSVLGRVRVTGWARSSSEASSPSLNSRQRGGTGVKRRLLKSDSKHNQPLPNCSGRYDHRPSPDASACFFTSKTVHSRPVESVIDRIYVAPQSAPSNSPKSPPPLPALQRADDTEGRMGARSGRNSGRDKKRRCVEASGALIDRESR